jgi:hypothetical protein
MRQIPHTSSSISHFHTATPCQRFTLTFILASRDRGQTERRMRPQVFRIHWTPERKQAVISKPRKSCALLMSCTGPQCKKKWPARR